MSAITIGWTRGLVQPTLIFMKKDRLHNAPSIIC